MSEGRELVSVSTVYGLSFLVYLMSSGSLVSCYIEDDVQDDIYIVPPLPQDVPYPLMLHERDVIHYVDTNKDFLEIGSGSFANITLGELRESGLPVVIKKFRKTSFYDILHEVRVHRCHLKNYSMHRKFTHPLHEDVLPVEVVEQDALLMELMQVDCQLVADLQPLQWAQRFFVVQEIVEIFCIVNILVDQGDVSRHRSSREKSNQQRREAQRFNMSENSCTLVRNSNSARIRTYIIDYGLATYKTGKLYKNDEKSLEGYYYLAPELVNHTYTSEASDVYAYGYILQKIGELFPEPSLQQLAHGCCSSDPKDRPELPEVIAKIERIYLDLTSSCSHDRLDGKKCQDLIRFRHVKRNENETGSAWDTQNNRSTLRDGITTHKSVQPKLVNVNGHFDCRTSIPVMNSKDFVHGETEWITDHEDHKDNAIRLAVLRDLNRTVIVKEFYNVNYEVVREETCFTMYLANMGVAPKVIGITLEYKKLSDIAFVQEFFGFGVTLFSFVKLTQKFEWDLKNIRKVSEDELDFDEVFLTRPDVCRVHVKQLFLSILSDYTGPICKAKSYRQRILENVARLLVTHLQVAHDSGLLINNFRTENIIVKWNGTQQGQIADTLDTAVDIRLVDLNVVTSLTRGLQFTPTPLIENKHTYVAPEVVLGRMTSVESDIYSACVAVRWMLLKYFSDDDVAVEFQRFRAGHHQSHSNVVSHCSRENGSCKVSHGSQVWTLGRRFIRHHYDSPYSKLQRLLLKCLHSSHGLRPSTRDIIQLLHEVSASNYDGAWF
uniref:Protein kinase domain-containing protein n=1 Tax=Biomphalaria glabrata TaxID=6526 RepID=A0A2C9KJR4_BIOGL